MAELKVILESVITCPSCGVQTFERMMTDACRYFYDCPACNEVLPPNKGHCCVSCSF